MDIGSIFQTINIIVIFKVFFLILLGLYIVFVVMLVSKLRSFDNIIHLPGTSGGGGIKLFAVIYLLLLVFTFITALVIV